MGGGKKGLKIFLKNAWTPTPKGVNCFVTLKSGFKKRSGPKKIPFFQILLKKNPTPTPISPQQKKKGPPQTNNLHVGKAVFERS